ncbi:MAG TPA: prephenate dehydrogenase [Oscillospiraceae bacterium]|nr:prephenate dehydrogenase [Oscillospiraceae bacterium]
MNITVVGLGLIGGSFCKVISRMTEHKCYGMDINSDVIHSAIAQKAIIDKAEDVSQSDLTIICLYPEATIEFILNNCEKFKRGSIVIDSCGIKKAITEKVSEKLLKCGVTFIGAHPMAGREFSGFDYSVPELFENASLILTPDENADEEKISIVRNLAYQLSFKKVVVTTPEEHDRIISYTSQLAHIVSSAYIKSPTAQEQSGFSAGSFKDLTRVARLNENMWTSLFLLNKENLISEISLIIDNLNDYKNALESSDSETLNSLLKEGRILKEKSMEL